MREVARSPVTITLSVLRVWSAMSSGFPSVLGKMERRESTGPGQWERREMAGDTRAEVRVRPSNPSQKKTFLHLNSSIIILYYCNTVDHLKQMSCFGAGSPNIGMEMI